MSGIGWHESGRAGYEEEVPSLALPRLRRERGLEIVFPLPAEQGEG